MIHTEKYLHQDPITSAHIRIQSETPVSIATCQSLLLYYICKRLPREAPLDSLTTGFQAKHRSIT